LHANYGDFGGQFVNHNQWISNAIGIPVLAVPSEATAIGNIMIQDKTEDCVNYL